MPATLASPAGGTTLSPMRLPNGKTILQLNAAETSLQYRDIVATRAYLDHGLSVDPGATIFDVGANIGLSCLFFHWEAPGVRVLAFEPAPLPFAALEANVAAHGLDAKTFRCGLSDRRRTAELVYYPAATAMTSMYADPEHDSEVTRRFLLNSGIQAEDVDDLVVGRHDAERVTCAFTTVSEVVASEGVEEIGLLKINVEKAEADVLAGIDERDWPKVGQITMQVHDLGGRVAAVRDDLAGRGFRVAVDQDPLLAGTDIFDLFARRT
jgi:31-O-methyltransferase